MPADLSSPFVLGQGKGPSQRALIVRLLSLGWRHRAPALLVLSLQMALVALGLAGLNLTGLAIDFLRHELSGSGPAPRWPLGLAPPGSWSTSNGLVLIAGLVLAVALAGALLRFLTALAGAHLARFAIVRLRSDVYDKLQRLSFRFFDANESSSIINRVAGDVGSVRLFIDGVILKVLSVLLSLAVYLAYMSSVHARLTLACLASLPILWIAAVTFSRTVQPWYRKSSELLDGLIRVVAENFQGVHVVKGFGREPEEVAKFHAANAAILGQKRRIFWAISCFQPFVSLLANANMAVLLSYGGYLVLRGELPLGAGLFVFARLLGEFGNQVGQVTNIANSIQTSLAGARRVFEILDASIAIQSPAAAIRLPRARGSVRFERVGFSYTGEAKILDDIHFVAEPGQCIGIVGTTGAGKSTLLALVGRFHDATSGRVLVDGWEVTRLDLDDLRRNIGIVFQDSFLFSNTVAANIAFGHPQATADQVERAARLAAAHEFIVELPQGYDTLVGEYGWNLSGGQRQRIAIARALLFEPPILIFDDATSAIDPETEHEIDESLKSAMRGRTTFLVSHRIASLRSADQVLVLDRGRIVQSGRPSDLLRQEGFYRNLAALQWEDGRVDRLAPAGYGEVA